MPVAYPFISPPVPSYGVYLFTTRQNVQYELRFGRKQSDILFANIVFGVLNDEYEGEEYTLVNKGEFYSVMQTIGLIIQDFYAKNPNIHGFEFAGEPEGSDEDSDHLTQRTRVYLRYARKLFPESDWKTKIKGNKVTIERKR